MAQLPFPSISLTLVRVFRAALGWTRARWGKTTEAYRSLSCPRPNHAFAYDSAAISASWILAWAPLIVGDRRWEYPWATVALLAPIVAALAILRMWGDIRRLANAQWRESLKLSSTEAKEYLGARLPPRLDYLLSPLWSALFLAICFALLQWYSICVSEIGKPGPYISGGSLYFLPPALAGAVIADALAREAVYRSLVASCRTAPGANGWMPPFLGPTLRAVFASMLPVALAFEMMFPPTGVNSYLCNLFGNEEGGGFNPASLPILCCSWILAFFFWRRRHWIIAASVALAPWFVAAHAIPTVFGGSLLSFCRSGILFLILGIIPISAASLMMAIGARREAKRSWDELIKAYYEFEPPGD